MEKYKEYEKFKNDVVVATNWVNNKNKRDSQSGTNYSLHNISFKAEYCGQAYAGANNYHKSPEIFNNYVEKVIANNYDKIFQEALLLMNSDLDKKLLLCQIEIEAIQQEIKEAKRKESDLKGLFLQI